MLATTSLSGGVDLQRQQPLQFRPRQLRPRGISRPGSLGAVATLSVEREAVTEAAPKQKVPKARLVDAQHRIQRHPAEILDKIRTKCLHLGVFVTPLACLFAGGGRWRCNWRPRCGDRSEGQCHRAWNGRSPRPGGGRRLRAATDAGSRAPCRTAASMSLATRGSGSIRCEKSAVPREFELPSDSFSHTVSACSRSGARSRWPATLWGHWRPSTASSQVRLPSGDPSQLPQLV